jgi:alpha-amylase
VRELGFDGYRVDTAKHFGESVSVELKREAEAALAEWRRRNAPLVRDSLPFYLMGEVYGWEIGHGRRYDFGDRAVDYFAHGYDGLINFAFKRDAAGPLDSLFTAYAGALAGSLRGAAVLNYVSSHDDGSPYDPERRDPLGAGTRLLLAPGGAQVYYGDELARPLRVPGAEGDANLRSVMDWASAKPGSAGADVLRHWRKLGRFRREHPAVGAGVHRTLREEPYIFSRTLEVGGRTDRVLVAMGQGTEARRIPVFGLFPEGTELVDAYSGVSGEVVGDTVALDGGADLVLLAPRR